MKRLVALSYAFSLICFASSSSVQAAPLVVAPIAVTGDAAPHGPPCDPNNPLTLDQFPEAPVLNNRNQILFVAVDSCGLTGLFVSPLAGPPAVLILEGDLSPVDPDYAFTAFLHYEIADSGDALVWAELESLTNIGETVTGIYFIDSTGTLIELAREGAASPVDPADTILSLSSNQTVAPVMNDEGHVAFFVDETLAGKGILYAEVAGAVASVSVAARNGDAIPAQMNNFFEGIEVSSSLVMNDNDEIAFHGGSTASTNLNVLFKGPPGNVVQVYSGNDVADLVLGLLFNTFTKPAINSDGGLVFLAKYQAGSGVSNESNTGIHSTDPDTFIAREGDPLVNSDLPLGEAYGDNVETPDDLVPVLNDDDFVALRSELVYTSLASNNAILAGRASDLQIIARAGDPVNSTTFSGIFSNPVVNARSHTAFQAALSDTNETGLFLYEPNGFLHYVALPGDTFEHPTTGAIETVTAVNFKGGSGNADGRPSGLNNLSIPILQMSFDGVAETGIFFVQICDLDANGIFEEVPDGRRFQSVCRNPERAVVRCDLDGDGRSGKRRDILLFRQACG
jgi:hypothetical protein